MSRQFSTVNGVSQRIILYLFPLWLAASHPALAQDRGHFHLAAAFPKSTVFYLEIPEPAMLVNKIFEHHLRERVESLEPVQRILRGPEMMPVQMFVGVLESQLEMTWREALQALAQKGLAMGFDSSSQGALLVSRAQDGSTLSRVVRTILGWVDLGSRGEGQRPAYQMMDYRGHRIARFDEFAMGRVDDWFVVSNQLGLLQSTMDRLIESLRDGFSSTALYQSANRMRDQGGDVWSAVDLEGLRRARIAPELFSGKTDNPGAELLLGGILHELAQAPAMAASLTLAVDSVKLSLSIPHDPQRVPRERSYFYASHDSRSAAIAPRPPETFGRVFLRRDLRGWWHSKEDLFEENVIAQLLQTDSELSILFAGLDFGNDILGALEPDLHMVVAQQTYNPSATPELKLPAFALVGTLREPGEIQRRLRIAYQSVIGFVNIQLAMEGYPQLDLMTESRDGAEISAATFMLNDRSQRGLVHYNFSPTLAFRDNRLVFSSTRELAQQLVTGDTTGDSLPANVNSWLHLDGEGLAEILRMNRQMLVVQNMMEQGIDKQTAENNIDLVLSVLPWIAWLDSRLEVLPNMLNWTTEVRFAK